MAYLRTRSGEAEIIGNGKRNNQDWHRKTGLGLVLFGIAVEAVGGIRSYVKGGLEWLVPSLRREGTYRGVH